MRSAAAICHGDHGHRRCWRRLSAARGCRRSRSTSPHHGAPRADLRDRRHRDPAARPTASSRGWRRPIPTSAGRRLGSARQHRLSCRLRHLPWRRGHGGGNGPGPARSRRCPHRATPSSPWSGTARWCSAGMPRFDDLAARPDRGDPPVSAGHWGRICPGAGEMIVNGDLLRPSRGTTPERLFALFEGVSDGDRSGGCWKKLAPRRRAGGPRLGEGDVLLLGWRAARISCGCRLGANCSVIVAPVDLAYKGSLLRHVIALDPPADRARQQHARRAGSPCGDRCTASSLPARSPRGSPIPALRLGTVLSQAVALPELPALHPLDTQCVLFTSGTTGGVQGRDRALACAAPRHRGHPFRRPGRARRPLSAQPADVPCRRAAAGDRALITDCAVVALARASGRRASGRTWRAYGVTGCTCWSVPPLNLSASRKP